MEEVPTIFVGIDYGTTGSTFSYIRRPCGTSSMSPRQFPSWPGLNEGESEKVPSMIAYPWENEGLHEVAWGYQVKPGMASFSWTKLLMEPNLDQEAFRDSCLENFIQIGIMRRLESNDTCQVVSDYLGELYKFICTTLRNELGADTLENHDFEFRFGIPAVWKNEAKSSFWNAICNAGFRTLVGPKKKEPIFQLIQEPQAVMTKLLADNKHQFAPTVPVQAGDGVMICDMGGGTVDLAAYEIESMCPNITYDQITKHTGSLWGATAVDRQFYTHMQNTFGYSFQKAPLSQKGKGSKFADEFEKAKCALGTADDKEKYLLPIGPGFDHSDPLIFNRKKQAVILSRQTLRGFFEPVTRNILRVLHEKVKEANEVAKGSGIKKIILCGGLSQSPYLSEAITVAFKQSWGITVRCLPDPLMAIADGAAYCGIGAPHPSRRVCPRNYGITYPVPFNYDLDSEADSLVDVFTGRKMALGVVDWLFDKSGLYSEGYTVYRTQRFPFPLGGVMARMMSI